MVSHRRRNRIALVLALLALLGLVAVAVAVAWPGADGGQGKAARAAVRPLPPASTDCDRRIQSRAFVVADARGRTLAALRPRVRRPVGSLVKLMTAGVVLNAGALDRQVSVPELRLQPDESRAGLDAGDRMTRRSLLRALLVPSGNDAAETLAITSPAGRTRFVRAMNREARRVGLSGTHYANPSGMPARGQRSTAADSVRLAVLLMADSRFRRVVSLRSIEMDGRTLRTRNGLLGRSPGVDGVKTGTLDGNWSMVASSSGRGGRVYAAVLGAPGPEARDRDAHCLLTLGRRLNRGPA